MSSKSLWQVFVCGLVSLGLLASAMAQPSGPQPIDADRVRLGFDAAPNSTLQERGEFNAESYYRSAGEREPATAVAPAAVNDDRYFNTHEESIIGPPPVRFQGVSARADDAPWAEPGGPALGRADGQPPHPGGDATMPDTAGTRKQKLAEVNASPAPTGAKIPLIDKTVSAKQSGKSGLTMGITMGLFASLAANFFFAWVAWDTHAKYQELVDDMDDHDGQHQRQDRQIGGDGNKAKGDCDAIAAADSRGLVE